MSATIHAGCILLGEAGLVIRGVSGSGKSMLADNLVRRWRSAGRFAAHVADDRLLLDVVSGRLLAKPHPVIAGQREIRGLGVVKMSHEPACILRAVVELIDLPGERSPDSAIQNCDLEGVQLPFATVYADRWLVDRVETFWFQTYL